MKSLTKTHPKVLLLTIALLCLSVGIAFAASVGQKLNTVQIRDAHDNPAVIPSLGQKVVAIIYNDCDEADLNDPLADALKAKNFPKDKYQAVGIANLDDSKAPNFLIRKIVQGKIDKYKTTILTDPDLIVPKAWGLGDCNNTSVVLIFDKNAEVKYVKKGPVRGAEITKVVQLVESLIN